MIILQFKIRKLSLVKKYILKLLLYTFVFGIASLECFALPSLGGHPHSFSVNKKFLCIGDTLIVTDTCIHDAFQPVSRIWSFSQGAQPSIINNQVQSSVTFNSPGIKIISLSVYDIFNVAYTDTMQIRVNGAIADAGVSKKYCNNSSGVIIGTSDTTTASITWTNSTGTNVGSSRLISVSPSQSCYYYLTLTKNSCITRDSVWVQNVNSPTANAGSNASVCNGAAVLLGSPMQNGLSYFWFPSSGLSDSSVPQPIAKPLTNTVYTLFVTDSNHCTSSAQVTVNVVNNLIANPGRPSSICLGDSIKIGSPQQAGWRYSWTPATSLNNSILAQPLAFPKVNTNYQLKVSAYGCIDSSSVMVTVKQLPSVDIGGIHVYHNCFGDTITIGGNLINGYTYSWSPSINLSSANAASTLAYPNKDTWYTLNVWGLNGCLNKDSLLIDKYDSIKAYAGLDQSICLGNSIILGAQLQVASGGSGKYIYQWSPSSTLNNSSIAHPVALTNQFTRYYLTVIDSTNTKCGTAIDSVDINIFPLPSFQLPFKKMFCKGEAPVSLSALPNGGQFSILINNQLVPILNNVFNPNDTFIHSGNPYLIHYVYTTAQGCTYDTAVSVIVKEKPKVNAGADIFYCPARGYYQHQLLGYGTGNPHWIPSSSLNNDTIFNPVVTNLSTQNFILQIDNGACSVDDTVHFVACSDTVILFANYDHISTNVNITDSISIAANDSSSINKFDHSSFSIIRTCKNGLGYIRQTANNAIFSYAPFINFVGNDTAIYILRDTLDQRVHEDTAIILIQVAPMAVNDTLNTNMGSFSCYDSLMHITFNDHFSPNFPISISILTTSVNGYFSINGLDILFHAKNKVFIDSLQYSISQNGISDTASIYLNYNCPSCHCKIPEGFSPNNDGKNDYLELLNTENCIPDCALIIYNRWGDVVYRTEHYETKWDGKYNGSDLPDGTYFYIINSSDNSNGGQTTGFLILQR